MPNQPAGDVVVQLDVVEHAAGVYYLSCQSPYGETSLQFHLPVEGTELQRRLQTIETNVLRSGAQIVTRGPAARLEKPVRELGEELCEQLLRDEARVLFEESLRQARRDDVPFRLLLRIRGATLSRLPWEFLYDRRRGDYLALNVPVVRYLEVMQPLAPVTVSLPLRILGVISRPEDREQLDIATERAALSEALAPLGADQVVLHWLNGQRWEDLWRARRSGPWHILHFIGHGGFDEDRGEGFLELSNERGEARPVYATDLGRLLQDNSSLRLAVLNACESARAGDSDSFSSPAASLIRRGFPAVVAMQYEISDPAALVFAQALYGAIAAGEPLDRAVTDARTTVQMSQPGSLEWGTPVLYLRSTSTKVFDIDTTSTPAAAPSPPPSAPSPPPSAPAAGPAAPAAGSGPSAESLRRAADLVKNWMTGQQRSTPPRRPPADAANARAPATPAPEPTPPDPAAVPVQAPVTPAPAPATGLIETHRFIHPAPVRAVTFDAAGRRVCAGGDDGAALCWDLDRAEVSRACRVPGLSAGIRALSLSRDGRYLAVAYSDALVRVWDLDTEVVAVAVRMPDARAPWAVRFSPDDALLVIAGTDRMAVITDRRGAEVMRLIHQPEVSDGANRIVPHDVHAAVFSPDGRWVATAASDGLVRLFDSRGVVANRFPHPGAALDVAFRPDGRRIATGASDGNARTWDARARVVGRLNHNAEVRSVAYSPDSRWLATGSADGTARLWLDDGDHPSAWALHPTAVHGVSLTLRPPTGLLLATANADHTVRVWARA